MNSDSFFGLDLQVNDPRLTGVTLDCRGSITPEIIQEAIERVRDAPVQPPCGCDGNPHLVVPRPIGQRTPCIQCGYPCVRISQTEWRDLNEEELEAGVRAMNRALWPR